MKIFNIKRKKVNVKWYKYLICICKEYMEKINGVVKMCNYINVFIKGYLNYLFANISLQRISYLKKYTFSFY